MNNSYPSSWEVQWFRHSLGQGDAIYFHLQCINGQCLFPEPLTFDVFVILSHGYAQVDSNFKFILALACDIVTEMASVKIWMNENPGYEKKSETS